MRGYIEKIAASRAHTFRLLREAKNFEEQMLDPPIMCERAESLSCARRHAPSAAEGGLITACEPKSKVACLPVKICADLFFLSLLPFFVFFAGLGSKTARFHQSRKTLVSPQFSYFSL